MGGWTSQVKSEYGIQYIQQDLVDNFSEDLANRRARPILVTCVLALDNNDACKLQDPNYFEAK